MQSLDFLLAPPFNGQVSGAGIDSPDDCHMQQFSDSDPSNQSKRSLAERAIAAREKYEEMETKVTWEFVGPSRWVYELELDEINDAAKTLNGSELKEFVKNNCERRNQLIQELRDFPARELAEAKSKAELQELKLVAEQLEAQINQAKTDRAADVEEAQARRVIYAAVVRGRI